MEWRCKSATLFIIRHSWSIHFHGSVLVEDAKSLPEPIKGRNSGVMVDPSGTQHHPGLGFYDLAPGYIQTSRSGSCANKINISSTSDTNNQCGIDMNHSTLRCHKDALWSVPKQFVWTSKRSLPHMKSTLVFFFWLSIQLNHLGEANHTRLSLSFPLESFKDEDCGGVHMYMQAERLDPSFYRINTLQ